MSRKPPHGIELFDSDCTVSTHSLSARGGLKEHGVTASFIDAVGEA